MKRVTWNLEGDAVTRGNLEDIQIALTRNEFLNMKRRVNEILNTISVDSFEQRCMLEKIAEMGFLVAHVMMEEQE